MCRPTVEYCARPSRVIRPGFTRRSSSCVFNAASRRWICRVTADGVRNSRSAARCNDPGLGEDDECPNLIQHATSPSCWSSNMILKRLHLTQVEAGLKAFVPRQHTTSFGRFYAVRHCRCRRRSGCRKPFAQARRAAEARKGRASVRRRTTPRCCQPPHLLNEYQVPG